MQQAPFFHDVVGPTNVEARWLTASDGVRLRASAWPKGDKGTVLLFSGRTEYVEKYTPIAERLGQSGLAVATIDWRGQGLSDRALSDPFTGHVADFADYQRDVAALREFVEQMGLPRPFYMLAHSMGGAIGLRALHLGLDVDSVTFSAPMWGIEMPHVVRPVAWSLSWASRALGRGHLYIPGSRAAPYVAETAFEQNALTSDRKMFEWMQVHVREHPELLLAGPSLSWLFSALHEMRALRALRPPPYPALCMFGSCETIVEPDAIRSVMRRWPGSKMQVVNNARHELMMEREDMRDHFLTSAVTHFIGKDESCAA